MRNLAHGGWMAALLWLAVLLVFDRGGAWPMLAQFGAAGALHAGAWNLLGFALPGLFVAAFALGIEAPMRYAGARRGGRIGSTLLLLSGLCFAAQSAFAYDIADPESRDSLLHVTLLSLTLIAFLPGALLVIASSRRARAWRALRLVGTMLALVVLLGVLLPPHAWALSAAIAERLMLAAYFAWIALASVVALRAARPHAT